MLWCVLSLTKLTNNYKSSYHSVKSGQSITYLWNRSHVLIPQRSLVYILFQRLIHMQSGIKYNILWSFNPKTN